eukprot:TRINITY_DN11690_c0_g1_i2.p1 TRINITY_DN11690_c0_g1~~TRINITY_DN11690_c0_g1_i2.p1  ORF type:complete len:467 (+),score=45.01 TRINITY_DN11690_c0_g1_i2:60-1403(+)
MATSMLAVMQDFQSPTFCLSVGKNPPSPLNRACLEETVRITERKGPNVAFSYHDSSYMFEMQVTPEHGDRISLRDVMKALISTCIVRDPMLWIRFLDPQGEEAEVNCAAAVLFLSEIPAILTELRLSLRSIYWIGEPQSSSSVDSAIVSLFANDQVRDDIAMVGGVWDPAIQAAIMAWRQRQPHRTVAYELGQRLGAGLEANPPFAALPPDVLQIEEALEFDIKPIITNIVQPVAELSVLGDWVLPNAVLRPIDITQAVNENTKAELQVPFSITGGRVRQLTIMWRNPSVLAIADQCTIACRVDSLDLSDQLPLSFMERVITATQPRKLTLRALEVLDMQPVRSVKECLLDPPRASCSPPELLKARNTFPEACWIDSPTCNPSLSSFCRCMSLDQRQLLLSDARHLWQAAPEALDSLLMLFQACDCADIDVPEAVAAALMKAVCLLK